MPNVNKRLRQIDTRTARISRRLGFLQTRLYFQPVNGSWGEVPILQAVDGGMTPKNLKTGEEISAHRYSVQVGRDWLDANAAISGIWAIAPDGIEANKMLCELEGASVKDTDTFGSLDFRIAQTIAVDLPTIEIPPIPPL